MCYLQKPPTHTSAALTKFSTNMIPCTMAKKQFSHCLKAPTKEGKERCILSKENYISLLLRYHTYSYFVSYLSLKLPSVGLNERREEVIIKLTEVLMERQWLWDLNGSAKKKTRRLTTPANFQWVEHNRSLQRSRSEQKD